MTKQKYLGEQWKLVGAQGAKIAEDEHLADTPGILNLINNNIIYMHTINILKTESE